MNRMHSCARARADGRGATTLPRACVQRVLEARTPPAAAPAPPERCAARRWRGCRGGAVKPRGAGVWIAGCPCLLQQRASLRGRCQHRRRWPSRQPRRLELVLGLRRCQRQGRTRRIMGYRRGIWRRSCLCVRTAAMPGCVLLPLHPELSNVCIWTGVRTHKHDLLIACYVLCSTNWRNSKQSTLRSTRRWHWPCITDLTRLLHCLQECECPFHSTMLMSAQQQAPEPSGSCVLCASASDICLQDQRVTLTGTDVMNALEGLGLSKLSSRCVPRSKLIRQQPRLRSWPVSERCAHAAGSGAATWEHF